MGVKTVRAAEHDESIIVIIYVGLFWILHSEFPKSSLLPAHTVAGSKLSRLHLGYNIETSSVANLHDRSHGNL